MLRALTLPFSATVPMDLASVHAAHANLVWVSLQRLGVRSADLEDVFQEVFVVVHRRLSSFDGRASLQSWLYGICVKVAAAHRRRAYVRREQLVDHMPEPAGDNATPEQQAERHQAQRRLLSVLDQLDVDKRAVFVMFELEEMSCEDIAEIVGVKVGTVYSRLHAARQSFEKALVREQSRAEWKERV